MRARVFSAILAICFMVPFYAFADPVKKVPDLGSSHMSIPWKDFKELLEMIEPEVPPEEEPKPPVPFAINSAHYKGGLVEGAAAFRFRIEFTVLDEKEWQIVPILPAGLAVKKIMVDDEPALVETQGGYHSVVLKSPGRHVVTGRFFAPTENRLGPRSVSLPIKMTPVTTLTFTIEEPDQEIKAEPAHANIMSYEENVSRLEAVLRPTSRVTISWGKKVEREEAALRVNAEVESLVSLGERLCQVESVIRYEILHRGVTGFKLALPKEATVVDVFGNGLADWKARKGPKSQLINVKLNYEARESYNLTVIYELVLPDATAKVEVPVLEVQDVSREIGHIGVAARTNIEVEVDILENLGTLDVGELPKGIDARSPEPLLFGFKYIGHPWVLKLDVTKHEDVKVLSCVADSADLTSFLTKDGELVTQAKYEIRNNVQQFMRLKLPKDARIFSTFRKGSPVRPAKDKQGNLLIPLEKSAGSFGKAVPFSLELTYLVELPKLAKRSGTIKLTAPESDIVINTINWDIYAPEEFQYKVKDSSLGEPKTMSLVPEAYLEEPGVSTRTEEKSTTISQAGNLDKDELYDHWVMNDARALRNVQVDTGRVDRESFVIAAKPVHFRVPSHGYNLMFSKSIIQKYEENSITLKYKKACKVSPFLKRLVKWVVVGTVIFIVVLLLLRRRRLKKQGVEAASQGVTS